GAAGGGRAAPRMAAALSGRTRSASGRRRLAALALVAGVVLLHGWGASRLADHLETAVGAAGASKRPPPIEVSFVRELLPSAPPATPPAPPPRPKRRAAAAAPPPAPQPAASAPDAEPAPPQVANAASVPDASAFGAEATALAVAEAAPVEAATPAGAEVEAGGEAGGEAVASAPAAPPFEWPPSTRLSYRLTGWYHGAVEGSAQVQWLREGERYQVHLEVVVGPTFAPLVARRMVSDGELKTSVIGRPTRRLTLFFDRDGVRLADGREVPRPDGLQDPSSQFVQMSWLFTLQPQLLRAGETVEFPLALPRRVERWRYEVLDEQRLDTPIGSLDAVHVRPSRNVVRRGQDLSAEAWFAPTLQYLPVRILIRQDGENYVDMTLSSRPLQGP
ncbi:MAG: DUF3108 domain-containing protein, partial [Burkholderiaceae bacterium]|nr:DUF3108 domain-containing protein [Burkholderiaceae bacterium]